MILKKDAFFNVFKEQDKDLKDLFLSNRLLLYFRDIVILSLFLVNFFFITSAIKEKKQRKPPD